MVTPTTPLVITSPAHIDPLAGLKLDEATLQRLANELARGLYDAKDVLEQYGITELLFNERIVNNPTFMTFYAEAHAAWHSTSGTKERVSAKSGIVFEEWLREANRLLHDPTNALAPKVELAKMLAKIANFEPERATEGSGNGVSVTINLGHARIHPQVIKVEKIIDAKAVEVAPEVVLPPQVSAAGAAPTASAPHRPAEQMATLSAFRDTQSRSTVVWPGVSDGA